MAGWDPQGTSAQISARSNGVAKASVARCGSPTYHRSSDVEIRRLEMQSAVISFAGAMCALHRKMA